MDLPGPLYCDASGLVKLYLPEPESDHVNAVVEGRRDLMASDLAVTEIVSAVARRRREGSLSAEHAARAHRAILADMESGLFQRIDLTPEVHRQAERFLFATDTVPLRAADALHLALAAAGGAGSLLAFDQRLRDAARAVGLHVVPGED